MKLKFVTYLLFALLPACSSAFAAARYLARASSSFFCPFRSSMRPSRRSDGSSMADPTALLAFPVSLSMMLIAELLLSF